MAKLLITLLLIAALVSAQEPCKLTKPCEDFAPVKHQFLPPKQINVCGKKIQIVLVKFIPVEKGYAVDGPTVGYTDTDSIRLVDTRTDGQMAATLTHEIFHVILTTDVSNDDTTVHDFIKKVAPCYIDTVFHSNPDLLVYLIGASNHMKLEQWEKIVPTTEKKKP